ncbi:nicotinate (nicotinamide) nucleotide adenylyltransferase [Paenibacillus endoradicis]|uniref:nicotinate (nicotinamide) nucleotide adenylyltransferase n=1 Tax=Paenibacillus endoradicis TaxID=2972487 RepID=UPI002158F931|nr:nicotinate (nicotinamide) nucleotide adenylyltransferase [Paenibacillus endoradicis]MCR8656531.1 nicotinate (nicotinamide) nucleotide adenylyltransferase [Paenibacillus endoradicis]
MKIGIYGSSFDPVTNVHLWTASTIAHRCKLDKVIFLPCSSKRQDKHMQTTDAHRIAMLKLAIADNDNFEIDDYEFQQLGWEIATYQTLRHFRTKYVEDDIYFIMGADLLVDIGQGKWQKSEELVKENKFIVMARINIDMLSVIGRSPILRHVDDGQTFHLVDKGLTMEISSTYVREEFKLGGEARYLIPESVYAYLKDNHLYR